MVPIAASTKTSNQGSPAPLADDEVHAELVERLRSIVLAPGYTPPRLPEEALELLRLTRQPDVGFDEVLAVLERDGMLAGQVLRTAQSPVYGGNSGIKSLQQALVRLGLHTLGDIFFATAMNQRVFRVRGYESKMASLRRHSLVTAQIARIISRYTRLFEDTAFLAGLLHDVGIAALVFAVTDGPHSRNLPPFEQMWPAIVRIHAETSGVLCQAWGLTADIVTAVRQHHSLTAGTQVSEVHALAAVVAMADDLARRLDAGAGESRASESVAAMRVLGLAEHAVSKIEVEASAIVMRIV